ncbi:MAG: Hpt domain-containing protein [Clostridia bacterium]|nr:Hpt domain-containing protein [Clostridia bacterium]NCC42828.1 Hpt domain-containing protein [Clostridia bacterium]
MNNALFEELEDMGAEVEDTLERLMGDEELYLEYLRKFPQNENIIELRKAVDAGDCDKAMKEVHTLKGVALNLGLLPMVDVCMDMLLDFRADKNDAAMAQIDEVEECFHEWADVIERS